MRITALIAASAALALAACQPAAKTEEAPAADVTTLDVVSGGRAQLGIGSGWFELEHESFGIEFGTFTDRFEKLEEALQVILPMLRDERPTVHGEHYRITDAINQPAPLGRVPVMVGGSGER